MTIRVTLESPYFEGMDENTVWILNEQADCYSRLASAYQGEEIGREWDMQNSARSLILNFACYSSVDRFLSIYFTHDEQWDVIEFFEIKEQA